jgi:hypothetical protein
LALSRGAYKPIFWFRYVVHDMFTIWPRQLEKLDDFLNHLYSKYHSKFNKEAESDCHLPFLNIETETSRQLLVSLRIQESNPYQPLSERHVGPPLESSAARRVSQETCKSFIVRSNRMAKMADRPLLLSTRLRGKVHLQRIQHH